jgi:hypothetical protein
MSVGGAGVAAGLVFDNLGPGLVGVQINAIGALSQVALFSGGGTGAIGVNDTFIAFTINNVGFNLSTSAGPPHGAITALAEGDVCIDTHTPGVWISQDASNSSWIQFGGVLPTSAAGLPAGSFWNNLGIVNVA